VGDKVDVVEEGEDIFSGTGFVLSGSTGTGMLFTSSKEFTEGVGGFIIGELFDRLAGLIWGGKIIGSV